MRMTLIRVLLFTLIAFPVFAQKDTLSFRERYLPTGFRFGTDAIAISRNFYDDSWNGWEVNADVDFYRYYLTFDYGTWGRTYPDDSVDYKNDGRYWRVGADVNFLTRDPERNMFFVGLRYGRGKFDERFRILDIDDKWGSFDETFYNNGITAQWFELTTGIKVRMFSWFWMGYTARFKFGLNTSSTPRMLPHDIPGYGRTDKETSWGFNYQLMFRIPYRSYPPLPPVKKKAKAKKQETRPAVDDEEDDF